MTALLDLFCGAGGAAVGYHRAGFDTIFGVDHAWQKNYPFDFIEADALEMLEMLIESGNIARFDLVHASPPCQRFSEATPMEHREKHPDLITPTREMLRAAGVPYVIENVENARAQLEQPVKLCGSMFDLRCYRHRYFEINPNILMLTPPCRHDFRPLLVTTAGSNSRRVGNYKSVDNAPKAYGIDWMTGSELAESIPPAYTEYIGAQLKLTEVNDV